MSDQPKHQNGWKEENVVPKPAHVRIANEMIEERDAKIESLHEVVKFQNEQILKLLEDKERLCMRLMSTNEVIGRAVALRGWTKELMLVAIKEEK